MQRAFEDLRADMNRHFNRLYIISGVFWISCSRSVDRVVLQVGLSQLHLGHPRLVAQSATTQATAAYRAGGACGFDGTQLPVR